MKLYAFILFSFTITKIAESLVIPQVSAPSFRKRDVSAISLQNRLGQTQNTNSAQNQQKTSSNNEVQLLVPKNSVPYKYIVVLKNDLTGTQLSRHKQWVTNQQTNAGKALLAKQPHHEFFNLTAARGVARAGGISYNYNITGYFSGYSGYFLSGTIDKLKHNKDVRYIEQVAKVKPYAIKQQKNAPWNLARISTAQQQQQQNHQGQTYSTFTYDDEGGSGVAVHVLDSGIDIGHKDFSGGLGSSSSSRALYVFTMAGNDNIDYDGHGTFVAGVIGSSKYGVAKKAALQSYKVWQDDEIASDSVIAALSSSYFEHNFKGHTRKGTVLNFADGIELELEGPAMWAENELFELLVESGVHVVTAAGNENRNASSVFPACKWNVITVGASNRNNGRWLWDDETGSNYGADVDVFAPGEDIESTEMRHPDAQKRAAADDDGDDYPDERSGTSAATAHVSGLVAYFLSLLPASDSSFATHRRVNPHLMKQFIRRFSIEDVLHAESLRGSSNLLAYNGGSEPLNFWYSVNL